MAGSRSTALDLPPTTSPEASTSAALSSYVNGSLMPETALLPPVPGSLPSQIAFTNDIYGSASTPATAAQAQSTEQSLFAAGSGKVNFTTPGQDAQSGQQPNYYLNAEGKLIANPKATPNSNGSINIEVAGNNTASKAKQYADQLQRQTISDLVAMYKAANPGAKVPEMWQAILDAQPDASSNTGDTQNNNTVTPTQEQAFGDAQPAAPATPDTPAPTTSADTSQPTAPASSDASAPADSTAGDGGSPSTGGSSGGGDAGGGSSGGSSGGTGSGDTGSGGGTPADFSNAVSGTADSASINNSAVQAIGQELWQNQENSTAADPFAGVTQGGQEGCAASVSMILENAGVSSDLASAAVGGLDPTTGQNSPGLATNLMNAGWTQDNNIADAKPGDVIYGNNGGTDQHIGVVAEIGGQLYCIDNDSDSNPPQVIKEQLNSSYIVEHFGANAHLLKPPGS